jgi:hypothetical protein
MVPHYAKLPIKLFDALPGLKLSTSKSIVTDGIRYPSLKEAEESLAVAWKEMSEKRSFFGGWKPDFRKVQENRPAKALPTGLPPVHPQTEESQSNTILSVATNLNYWHLFRLVVGLIVLVVLLRYR